MPNAEPVGAWNEAGIFANEGSIGGPYGAAGGAVLGLLDGATGGNLYTNTHKAPSVPVAPKWIDINPDSIQTASVAADKAEYARDDALFRERYPELAAARDKVVKTAADDATGNRKSITSALEGAGLTSEAKRFQKSGGKQSVEQESRDLGLPIASLGQRDRNYFARLFGENPMRPFGLNGDDVTNIAVSNAQQSAINQDALFHSRLNLYNSAQAQQGQNYAALASGISSGFSQAIKDYYSSLNQRDPGISGATQTGDVWG
jgi:hypothetical protein